MTGAGSRERGGERRRATLHGVVALLVVFFCSACVILMPPIDAGPDCQVHGSSACGTCLREQCQPTINECCGDGACRGVGDTGGALTSLDECAEGKVDACVGWVNSSRSSSQAGVRSCLVASCREECLEGAAAPITWSCDVPRARTTPCAGCIYSRCGARVDACCEHGACRVPTSDIAEEMGACVGGDERACLHLRRSSMAGTEGALRACIFESCLETCLPEDLREHTKCTLGDGGRSCSCTYGEASSGGECSAAAVGGSACAEGRDGCACGSYGCESGGYGSGICSCDFRGSPGGDTSCRGQHCCVRYSGDTAIVCECGPDECTEGNPVDSCDEEDVLAELDELGRLLATCSN